MLFSIVIKTWLQSVHKIPNRGLLIIVAIDAQNRYLGLKRISPLFCIRLLRHKSTNHLNYKIIFTYYLFSIIQLFYRWGNGNSWIGLDKCSERNGATQHSLLLFSICFTFTTTLNIFFAVVIFKMHAHGNKFSNKLVHKDKVSSVFMYRNVPI